MTRIRTNLGIIVSKPCLDAIRRGYLQAPIRRISQGSSTAIDANGDTAD